MANVQEEESIFCSRRTDKSTDILGPCGNDDVAIRTRECTCEWTVKRELFGDCYTDLLYI